MFGFTSKSQTRKPGINDIEDQIGRIKLIDVREPSEFRAGSIRTAMNIPMDRLMREPEKYIDKETTCYLFCQSGGRSGQTASFLAAKGYDVVNLGGFGMYRGKNRV